MKLASSTLLLAQRNPFSDMGAGFRDKKEHFDGSELLLYAALIVFLFAAIAAIAWIINRRDRHQLYSSPRGLFRALCRIHQLDRAERKLIAHLASSANLTQPSQAFLEPDIFDDAARDAAYAQRREEIVSLSQKLFAVAEPSQAG